MASEASSSYSLSEANIIFISRRRGEVSDSEQSSQHSKSLFNLCYAKTSDITRVSFCSNKSLHNMRLDELFLSSGAERAKHLYMLFVDDKRDK